MPLTDKQIKNLAPLDTKKKYFDGEGLYLEVRPNGSKYWRYKYRYQGKEKLLAIGVYPDISLKDARLAKVKAQETLRDGLDPSQQKKSTPKETNLPTFESVSKEWITKKAWSPSHERTVRQRLEKNVYPHFGGKLISEVTPLDILNAMRLIESRGAYETAHKTLGICSLVFRYAVASCIIESDPTRDLRGALTTAPKGKYAAITSAKGAGALMRAIEDYSGYRLTRLMLLLHAYTFCRPGEIRKAEWSEIDFAESLWIIPASKMKKGLDHIVPLSRQASEILLSARPLSGHCQFVFPSIRSDSRPTSDNTANAALRRMGFTKEEMTAHGFRAMASTLLNESGKYRSDVIEAQLAHVPSDQVRAAYNRARYISERKVMMQEWADYLDSLK